MFTVSHVLSVAQYVHGKPCSDSAPDRMLTRPCSVCTPDGQCVCTSVCTSVSRSVAQAQYVHGTVCSVCAYSVFTVSGPGR